MFVSEYDIDIDILFLKCFYDSLRVIARDS